MPITSSAIKKVRTDLSKEEKNKAVKTKVRRLVKTFRANPNNETLSEVFSMLDRASKKNVFHKRKVDRIKSRLSKLVKTPAKKQTGKSESKKKK